MDTEEMTPVEKLERAIQVFINETEDEGPILLDTAVVIWEQMRYEDDGEIYRKVNYSIPTTRASLSATVGLLRISDELIASDILGDDRE